MAIAVSNFFRSALPTPARRDPLAIDLDGDSIETVGITATPILFDHNADGIRTGTGWVKADDAWLVLDRDGNGLIDSGRELFGVDTLLSGTPGVDAVYASTGFAALAALNSNGDGVFNASDAAFAQVRVWQDLNQDGISQGTELFTLAQKNIASIGLTPTTSTVNLGNGNTVTAQATVTRTNGTTTQIDSVAVGADSTAGNLNLANNPFYREFTDSIPLTAAAQALPEKAGSGVVRDLREAMSLGNPPASSLVSAVQTFSAGTTRDAQRAALDDVLRTWAATEAVADRFNIEAVGAETRRFVVTGSTDTALQAQLNRVIPVLEVFNGITVDQSGWTAATSTVGGQTIKTYTMAAAQASSMLAAYTALSESVYSALVVQTRLKPYLDGIELVIGETGIAFDTAPLKALAQTKIGSDASNAVADLLDLRKYAGQTLTAVAGDPNAVLADVLQSITITPALTALLAAEHTVALGNTGTNFQVTDAAGSAVLGNAIVNVLTGIASGADKLYGLGGNDTLTAVGNGDRLDGGAGDDVLKLSSASNNGTTFVGGAGNDAETGGVAADTYIFNLGDGQDTVTDNSTGFESIDRLSFGAGVAPGDVSLIRSGADLLFKLTSGANQIKVTNWFSGSQNAYQIERVNFIDETEWTNQQINTRGIEVFGTSGNDSISGLTAYVDILHGLDGNDTLTSAGNGDTLDGGDGNDVLTNSYQNTTLIGGKGNDTMTGGSANDLYIFNLGDGQDSITDVSGSASVDVLQFGAGIAAADIMRIRSGNNLIMKLINSVDQVTIKDWFYSSGAYQIEQIKFTDGPIWTKTEINAQSVNISGTAGNDALVGFDSSIDHIHGEAGNDTITGVGDGDTLDGGAGNDVLTTSLIRTGTIFIGGRDNDILNGSRFDDTYQFNIGDGQDLIYETADGPVNMDVLNFGLGIGPADVIPIRSGLDLVFKFTNSSDQITVKYWFGYASGDAQIERISFVNGTNWVSSQITTSALEVVGTAGDDTLSGVREFSDVLRGLAGNDVLQGNGAGDTLDGGKGNDSLIGLDENDTYIFNSGDGQDTIEDNSYGTVNTDIISFGEGISVADVTPVRAGLDLVFNLAGGTDKITVKSWFDRDLFKIEQIKFADQTIWTSAEVSARALEVFGTSGDDVLTGNSGAGNRDVLHGLVGNDTLTAVGDGDTLDGGLGDDTLRDQGSTTAGMTTFIGGEGSDNLNGGEGVDTYVFNLGDGQDTITDYSSMYVGGAIDMLKFGTGIAPVDVTPLQSGSDLILKFTNSTDQVTIKNWFSSNFAWQVEQVEFVDGTTWTREQITAHALEVFGTQGDDSMVGGNLYVADVLHGLGGNDTLVAYGQVDILDGGLGNDVLMDAGGFSANGTTFIGGQGNDQLTGEFYGDTFLFNTGDGQDTLIDWGGGGFNDSLRFGPGISAANVTTVRAGDDLELRLSSSSDKITVKSWFSVDPALAQFDFQLETVTFADGNAWSGDQITAQFLVTTGTTGADNLVTVISGMAETLLGLAGNDTLSASGRGEILDGGEGNDVLFAVEGNGNLAQNLTFIGGKGNDTITGSYRNDSYLFNLGDGADVITDQGGDEADVLVFGAGITPFDIRVVRSGDDLVLTHVNGTDSMTVKHWFAAGSTEYQIEQVKFTGSNTVWTAAQVAQMIFSTGTTGNDALLGTEADDILFGLAGNDSISALGGADRLDGGAGVDAMTGGVGNDTYLVDNAADTTLEVAGEGFDAVESSISWTLAAEVEQLTLTGTAAISATGNALANTLIGNAGANRLNGGTGADTMTGGAGNDTYVVDAGDVVVEVAGGGFDAVESANSWTLQAEVEKLTLTGTAGINAMGNALANTLIGNGSYNRLNGGAGADTMTGGAGSDTYVVDNAGDTTIEVAYGGTDAVESTISWTLAAEIEKLALLGTSGLSATGNASANTLIGNAGSNRLDGGTGADAMTGVAGNDTYVVDNAGDTTIEVAAGGTDAVESSISWTLAAEVEKLTLTGTANTNGTGNAAANTLIGNAGTNLLTGDAGNDSMSGAEGGDTYVGGMGSDAMNDASITSNDIYVWGRGEGADTLTDAGGTDRLDLLAGVTEDQIWLRHVGNNLQLSVIGTTDTLTINGWYSNPTNQVESFKLADGQALLASQVQQLVDAMASFAPPAAGQTTLPANYQTALNPVIAPSWA